MAAENLEVGGPREAFKVRLERAWEKSDFALMVLGFAYLGIYAVEVLQEPTGAIERALVMASLAIYVLFAFDLLVRFLFALPTLGHFSGWVAFVKTQWLSIVAVTIPHLRSLRVLKILIVLRGIAPYMVNRSARVGALVGVALPLVLFTGSLAALEAERYAPGASITSFGEAFWWSIVSVTTVGYGDTYPVTADGRAVAGILMFVGIGLFSALTALLAAWVARGTNLVASGAASKK